MTAKEMLGAGLDSIAQIATPLENAKTQVNNAITQFDVELKQAFEDGKHEGAKAQGVDKIYSKEEVDAFVAAAVAPLNTAHAALQAQFEALKTSSTITDGKLKTLQDYITALEKKWNEEQTIENQGEASITEMFKTLVQAFVETPAPAPTPAPTPAPAP
jgi:hypothetical protein